MFLPFAIYLQYPYVMIQPNNNFYPFVPGNGTCGWGVITDVNSSSVFNIDNVVFYKSIEIPTIYDATPSDPKDPSDLKSNVNARIMIDEANIIFVNA